MKGFFEAMFSNPPQEIPVVITDDLIELVSEQPEPAASDPVLDALAPIVHVGKTTAELEADDLLDHESIRAQWIESNFSAEFVRANESACLQGNGVEQPLPEPLPPEETFEQAF